MLPHCTLSKYPSKAKFVPSHKRIWPVTCLIFQSPRSIPKLLAFAKLEQNIMPIL